MKLVCAYRVAVGDLRLLLVVIIIVNSVSVSNNE